MPAYFDRPDEEATVNDVKRWLRVHANKGAICPCCKSHVKIYRRALGSQMARWLIWLVRTWEPMDKASYGDIPPLDRLRDRIRDAGTNRGTWVDVKLSPVRGGDYAKLLHWDLIEQKSNEELEKKRADGARPKDTGLWRPTFKGIDFVHRRIAVPSHVLLYRNMLLGKSDDLIKIHQALGKKFDYHELMRAPVNVEVPV